MNAYQAIAALCLIAGPAAAEVNLTDANACFDAALQNQTNPAACIDLAQNPCLDNVSETPAVSTLCFVEARAVWSEGLATIFADTIAGLDENTAAVAQIETKYDLLGNLLQCDRIEELSIAVSDMDGDAIALQTARCQASASAATYMRLYLRAAAIGEGDL